MVLDFFIVNLSHTVCATVVYEAEHRTSSSVKPKLSTSPKITNSGCMAEVGEEPRWRTTMAKRPYLLSASSVSLRVRGSLDTLDL